MRVRFVEEPIPPVFVAANRQSNGNGGRQPSTQMAGERKKYLVYFIQGENEDEVIRTRQKPEGGQVRLELCQGTRGLWYRRINGEVALDNPIVLGRWDMNVASPASAGLVLAVGVDSRPIPMRSSFLLKDVFGREVFYDRVP